MKKILYYKYPLLEINKKSHAAHNGCRKTLDKQLIPGTYEWTMSQIVDNEIDLTPFDGYYKNDKTGASAIEPRILLKIIFYGCRKGQIPSRKMMNLCLESVTMKALAEDMVPDFTTIAAFIRGAPRWQERLKALSRSSMPRMALKSSPWEANGDRGRPGGIYRLLCAIFSSAHLPPHRAIHGTGILFSNIL